MIVVDVNIIVYLLTETPQRQLAYRLYQRDGDWWAPPLWRHEMLNVLATLTRQGVIERLSAFQVWRNAIGLLTNKERQPDMEHALTLAMTHAISAYDAQYVALAEALGVLLVSEDKKLQRTLPDRVISLTSAAGQEGA